MLAHVPYLVLDLLGELEIDVEPNPKGVDTDTCWQSYARHGGTRTALT